MIILYVSIIVLANIITAMFQPIHFYGLIIPCGSFLVGITFFLRDFLQLRIGKTNIYLLIVLAALISCVVSIAMGDSTSVAIASVVAFFVSEMFDTELFTRMNTTLEKRVVVSGIVGGALDSTIFVVIALSPIGSDVLPWDSVWYAILGQTIVKCCMQGIALPIMRNYK